MNPIWDAAQAALALVDECLGEACQEYPRRLVETATPPADCATLAIVLGSARARSGSCVGKIQLYTSLDIHLIRCCDPSGKLTDAGGYTPPTPEAIEAAAACIVRDAWEIYSCLMCRGCEVIGAISGVEACCTQDVGPPEIRWGAPSGLCRSATVSLPLIVTNCCPPPEI